MLNPEQVHDLAEAAAGLEGVAVRTPLIPADGFEHPVRLKAEHLQPVGAFKIRGAWTALRRLDPAARARGVVTSSSGNHGYALAWSAQRMGIRAVIVMPESTPAIKQENVRSVGGEVRLAGATRGPEQQVEAERLAGTDGLVPIPPFDHPDVIAGQATCTLEILEDWPEVAAIALPVGGGGLLAGAALAVRAAARPVRLYGVEPEEIPKLSWAVAAGHPVELAGGTSLADGLLTRSIGRLTWPVIQPMLAGVFGVSDDELRSGMRWLAARGIRAEPSGAATAAALLAGKLPVSGPTALVVSGGNVDPARHHDLVS